MTKPIHEQLIGQQKVKDAKQRQMYYEDDNNKFEFKPIINEISSWIAEQKHENKNVYKRLTENNSNIDKKLEYEDDNCTFQPNKNNISFSSKDSKINKFDEFLERQKKFLDNKELNLNNNYKDENCTFKPKINVCSEFLVETNQLRRNETDDERVDRL